MVSSPYSGSWGGCGVSATFKAAEEATKIIRTHLVVEAQIVEALDAQVAPPPPLMTCHQNPCYAERRKFEHQPTVRPSFRPLTSKWPAI